MIDDREIRRRLVAAEAAVERAAAERVATVAAAAAAGWSTRRIAALLGLSHVTVWKMLTPPDDQGRSRL